MAKLALLEKEKTAWLKNNPRPHSKTQRKAYHLLFPQRLERWLDQGHGSRLLARPEARDIVAAALRHFDGSRYQLDEFVVASTHVHALLSPAEGETLSSILHSWKSYTAKQLLKLSAATALSTAPKVWQKESWDHLVRSPASLEKFRQYIRSHPEHPSQPSNR